MKLVTVPHFSHLVFGLLTVLLSSTQSQGLQADLFNLKAPDSPPEYHFSSVDTNQNQLVLRENVFTNAKGQEAAREKLLLKIQNQHEEIESYELDQFQTKIHVKVTHQGGKYEIERQVDEGTKKHDSFDAGPDVLLPPGLLSGMKEHWDLWQKNGKWEFTLLVPDLMMKVSMVVSVEQNSATRLRLKMKPSFWMISAFVTPLYFEWDTVTHQIVQAEGQTLLQNEKSDPFRAKTIFRSN